MECIVAIRRWCVMAASSGRTWWDRDVDGTGRAIRADVRQAGHKIWGKARYRVRLTCGDDSDAAWLMESAVERISRYLDRKAAPLFASDLRWLLLTAFCRLLGRYARKLERLKLVGNISDLPEPERAYDWAIRANGRADLTKILRRLDPRSYTIFSLRLVGFTWREIADTLRVNELAVKRSFWREIRRVQNTPPERPGPQKRRPGPEV
jgi:DNA-directed RNA polymerase specialized sigma24 family protein